MSFTVSIIGRPNVGKSTLFNTLIKKKKSIVENISGVTRDRLYEKVQCFDKEFMLIDTGGITLEKVNFAQEIKIQAEIAMQESDLILFVVDGMSGITFEDEEVANLLRKKEKEVIVIVNKVDNKKILDNIYDFYQLGFEKIIPISSIHGNGIYDILEEIEPKITDNKKNEEDTIKFSLIGRPNVGKSTLFNAIIRQERSIVSDIDGTTRDTIDFNFKYNNQKYTIVDTAGINRRGKVYEKIEKYAVLRAQKAIQESDIILWVIDADMGLIEQDKKVLGYAFEEKKPIIIIVNKWDLIKKETNTQKEFMQNLYAKMPFVDDCEMIFLSALEKKGINKILPTIEIIYQKYSKKISTAKLNEVLNDACNYKVHPSSKGKPIRFYYITQVASKPPTFLIFVNDKTLVHFSYKRYLENYIKKSFKLEGIPIILMFRDKKEE